MGGRPALRSAAGFLGAHRLEALAVAAALSIAGASMVFTSPAGSTPDHLDSFNSKYGTQGSKLNSCGTCHTDKNSPSKGNLNPYGTDFAANNHDFAAIEPKDSDGDGHPNIDEINGQTFPGDPADYPGATPPEPEPPPTTTTTTSPSPLPIDLPISAPHR